MFCKTLSAVVQGIDATIVYVEADVSNGMPMFNMVGFLGSEVKEAKERVRTAIRNSGFSCDPKRITLNLSPADVKKEGNVFDLPIAIAILAAFGYIPQENLQSTLICGELSLNGEVKKINGVLPMVGLAKEQQCKRCIVPNYNAKEGAVIQGIEVIGVRNLKEAVLYLNNEKYLENEYVDVEELFNVNRAKMDLDFCDVAGQEVLKRAIEVAVSGMHNLIMIGPPGVGKTMLAKRIPTIMPDLTYEESLAISKIYSISGLLTPEQALIVNRPFRNPHYTITPSALLGGGKIPKPGEVSLASKGVLFLDELPEFQKNTLENLRLPLEEQRVSIARLHSSYEFPTDFILVGAMNPCPCGYYPDMDRCQCRPNQIRQYLGKISHALMDRIDIAIEATPVDYSQLHNGNSSENSETIKKRIVRTRLIQQKRYVKEKIQYNSQLTPRLLRKYADVEKTERDFLEQVFEKLQLSARAYHRVLKVARTIADMEESETIQKKHISEAVCYRSMEQKYWEVKKC